MPRSQGVGGGYGGRSGRVEGNYGAVGETGAFAEGSGCWRSVSWEAGVDMRGM